MFHRAKFFVYCRLIFVVARSNKILFKKKIIIRLKRIESNAQFSIKVLTNAKIANFTNRTSLVKHYIVIYYNVQIVLIRSKIFKLEIY